MNERQIHTFLFIDYSKAFDKVKSEDLSGMQWDLNVDKKDLRVLKNFSWEEMAAIGMENEHSEYRLIKQLTYLGPVFMNIYDNTADIFFLCRRIFMP